ncbi:MAG: carbohydrate porin [Verrucomicrobia bacterium]|nr:carbohydrate porin [Verrucomicrobiota bacterium]
MRNTAVGRRGARTYRNRLASHLLFSEANFIMDLLGDLMQPLAARRRACCYAFLNLLFAIGVIHAASADERGDDASINGFPSPPETRRLAPEELNALLPKGFLTLFPPVEDTLLGDTGGWRSGIGKYGIGFSLFSSGYAGVNVLNGQRTPQRYDKQSFSVTAAVAGTLTLNLDRIFHIPNAQFLISAEWIGTTFNPVGPRAVNMNDLLYYQTFFNGKLGLQIGYLENDVNYANPLVGPTIITPPLGPLSIIPYEVGMSRRPFSSPGMNVEVKPDKRIYLKGGIQRSLNPQGPEVEHNQNPTGFRFRAPGDGWMVLGEAGYDTGLVAGERRCWIRGGGQYNWSSYLHFDTGRTGRGNWCAYLFADQQLTQPDPTIPLKGIYLGGTCAYASPEQNVFSQYYEGRIYGFGLFPTRELDQWEVSVDYNKWSSYAGRAVNRAGIKSYGDSTSVNVGYTARLRPGMYVGPVIAYLIHPAFTPRLHDALTVSFDFSLAL